MIANSSHRARNILVVDGDPVALQSLRTTLMAKGYSVTIALEGLDAMTCVRFQRPDLILSELFFPPNPLEGSLHLDGFAFISWLNTVGKAGKIPVIVISSADNAKFKKLSLAVGVQAFLTKPLKLKKLIVSIQAALKEGGKTHRSKLDAIRETGRGPARGRIRPADGSVFKPVYPDANRCPASH